MNRFDVGLKLKVKVQVKIWRCGRDRVGTGSAKRFPELADTENGSLKKEFNVIQ